MTRDDILLAAAQVFSEKGFHAASMQDIAERVNLQKASLYHHVSSKQEILVALLDRALDLLTERLMLVMDQPLPIEDKLRQAMASYLETLTEHRELSAVLLMEYRSLDPELYARHIPRRDRYESLWRVLIQQGIEEGVFCCCDPVMATRALLGVMNWTITWYRKGGPLQPLEVARQYTDLFLFGLLNRMGEKDEPAGI
jgi:AcrR family transcriptional regulator